MEESIAVIKVSNDKSMYQGPGRFLREEFPNLSYPVETVLGLGTHFIYMNIHGHVAVEPNSEILDALDMMDISHPD